MGQENHINVCKLAIGWQNYEKTLTLPDLHAILGTVIKYYLLLAAV